MCFVLRKRSDAAQWGSLTLGGSVYVGMFCLLKVV